MKLHAVNSTSFRLLYRSTIRINTAFDFCHTVAVAEEYNTESLSKISYRYTGRAFGHTRRSVFWICDS